MSQRACGTCGGSGYTYEPTVKVKDPVSFVLMVVEAFIPMAGKATRCWRCRGRGYYEPIKTNYRR